MVVAIGAGHRLDINNQNMRQIDVAEDIHRTKKKARYRRAAKATPAARL
jgi:hypothetical protein